MFYTVITKLAQNPEDMRKTSQWPLFSIFLTIKENHLSINATTLFGSTAKALS
jgi:hypothetical protein